MNVTLTVFFLEMVTSVHFRLPRRLKRHGALAMIHPIPHRYTLPPFPFSRIPQPQLTALRNLESLPIPIQILCDDLELPRVPQIDIGGDTKIRLDKVNRGIWEHVFAPAQSIHARYGIGADIGADGGGKTA